jgi:hypothetical protein
MNGERKRKDGGGLMSEAALQKSIGGTEFPTTDFSNKDMSDALFNTLS